MSSRALTPLPLAPPPPAHPADPHLWLPVHCWLDRQHRPHLPQHGQGGRQGHRQGDHHRCPPGPAPGLPGRRLAPGRGQRAARRHADGEGGEHHRVPPVSQTAGVGATLWAGGCTQPSTTSTSCWLECVSMVCTILLCVCKLAGWLPYDAWSAQHTALMPWQWSLHP